MAIIKLTKGYETLVDDGLFDELNSFSWYAQGREPNVRPARKLQPSKVLIYIYHQILQIHPSELNGRVVDHIDRNPLNNLRDNLRLVTQYENMQNSIRAINKVGVSIDRRHSTFKAYYDYPGCPRTNIGTFKTREEAEAALAEYKRRVE